MRGAAFAFAGQLTGFDRARRPLQIAFGVASAATPLVFGATAAGLARQRLVVDGTTVRSGGGTALWLGPFQLEVGVMAVAACTALAAAFLTVEMRRADEVILARAFRGGAIWATAVTALLAAGGLALAALDAPVLFRGLTGRGLPAVLAGLAALGVALAALAGARDRVARAALAAAMAALVWGWGLAQFPRVVGRHVTVANAAADPAELHVLAIALAAGVALLLPALWLLYGAFRRHPHGGPAMTIHSFARRRARTRAAPDPLPALAAAVVIASVAAPWALGFAGSHAAIAGSIAFAMTFGPIALLVTAVPAAAATTGVAGAWLAASPWALGYAGRGLAAWPADLALGLALMAIARAALRGRAGTEAPARAPSLPAAPASPSRAR